MESLFLWFPAIERCSVVNSLSKGSKLIDPDFVLACYSDRLIELRNSSTPDRLNFFLDWSYFICLCHDLSYRLPEMWF